MFDHTGAGFGDYSEESLVDPHIVALSKKIHTYVDEEIEQEWQKTKPRGARVTVRLTSGQTYTECVHMLRTMKAEDVDEKVRQLGSIAIDARRCEQLIQMVRNLEEVRDISCVAPMLTHQPGSTR